MERALSLMGVGMVTVFLVLSLVVVAGNILIRIINTFAPEGEDKKPDAPSGSDQTSPQKIAAITSAVYHTLGGQGKIEKIEKL